MMRMMLGKLFGIDENITVLDVDAVLSKAVMEVKHSEMLRSMMTDL